jgi:hypothetical protein
VPLQVEKNKHLHKFLKDSKRNGHVPPQMVLVNGALANVTFLEGKGFVDITYK